MQTGLAVFLCALAPTCHGRINSHTTRATLAACLDAANVNFLGPESENWPTYVLPFNERVEYTPTAVALPTSVDDIQNAVSCGVEQGVKVTPKSGGHSYASLGLGGEDGHLVIDLEAMRAITLDSETNIATVGPGARLGQLALEIFNQGNRSISHGTCPGVGVSGHALHGGFGMSSHTHGLALDWVKEITVVLANSTIVECSESEHSELFWAMLGAGSNFGIAASYKFRTFEAPSNVTWFSASLPWNKTTAQAGLEALEDYARHEMPAELNMRLAGSSFSASIEGVFYGNRTELDTALDPLLSKTNGSISSAKTTDWISALEHYAYADLNVTYPYDVQETFYSKSLALKGLNGTSAGNFVDYWYGVAKNVRRSWWFQVDLHGGSNSAVWKLDTGSTSYAHRDKLYLIQFYDRVFGGEYPEDGFDFLDQWVSNTTAPLEPSDWGMYVNYADARISRDTAQRLYWGENLARLQTLKTQLDPDEVFYYPISISPAVQG